MALAPRFPVSEAQIFRDIKADAKIEAGVTRHGGVRRRPVYLPRPRAPTTTTTTTTSLGLPPVGQEEEEKEEEEKEERWAGFVPSSPPPPTPEPWRSPSPPFFDGFGVGLEGGDDEMEMEMGPVFASSPSPSPAPQETALPSTGGLHPEELGSQAHHRWIQSAPTTRLPWAPEPGVPKTVPRHSHREQGRWYFTSEAAYEAADGPDRKVSDHIGLIMETTLGEQRLGDQRCEHCQEDDLQCWVYTREAMKMVSRASTTCARCRFTPRKGGCSFSTRKQSGRVEKQPARQRPLAPKG
ncbi:hypothetical protein EK21DRAFT_117369 [Setomelanomma holmii]|uniref:Uncharacterized protein n=1 Tax=Setomelanomma holmii TaxID=210430 RepID=A0A9P4GXQ2_9PLEO|nr:hypothetical protein EK21DRAFT_117369 [Setomelanomma holmii]